MIDRIMSGYDEYVSLDVGETNIEKILMDRLNYFISWQETAKRAIVTAITGDLDSIIPKKWPIATLFFYGPTGTGKTEISHVLATILLWSPDRITKVKCEHFQEHHSITNLIWAPKSYVGYWDAPVLSKVHDHYKAAKEAWELNPLVMRFSGFNILVFDEIEKAHPRIHQALLWIMDDGKLTLSNWDVVDFATSVIIMTSNIWAREKHTVDTKSSMWFIERDKKSEKADINKQAFKLFSPEFLWRLDATVEFNELTYADCHRILEIQAEAINLRFIEWHNDDLTKFRVHLDEDVYAELIKRWYSQDEWARSLKRVFDKEINSKLGRIIQMNPDLANFSGYQVTISAVMDDGEIRFRIFQPDVEKLQSGTKNNVTKLLPNR